MIKLLAPWEYHLSNHDGPFPDCWRCGRARAICHSKHRFPDREDVDRTIQAINERRVYENPLVRYPCRWCLGWHMTTAKSKRQRGYAEHARRKWLIARATVNDSALEQHGSSPGP